MIKSNKITNSILFLFILISINANSQNNFFNYNKQIIYAQNLLVHNNYKPALDSYMRVFAVNNIYYAKDCINALQIACFLNDKNRVDTLMRMAYSKGLTEAKLNSITLVKKFLILHNLRPDKAYLDYREQYFDKIDFVNRADINVFKKTNEIFEQMGTINKKYPAQVILNESKTANIKKFSQWINKIGYPGESNHGLADESIDLIKPKQVLEDIAEQIYISNPEIFFYTKTRIEEALKLGAITPNTYATFYENAYRVNNDPKLKNNLLNDIKKPIKEKFYNMNATSTANTINLGQVDIDRAEIGLEPLVFDAQLIAFMAKTQFIVFR